MTGKRVLEVVREMMLISVARLRAAVCGERRDGPDIKLAGYPDNFPDQLPDIRLYTVKF